MRSLEEQPVVHGEGYGPQVLLEAAEMQPTERTERALREQTGVDLEAMAR